MKRTLFCGTLAALGLSPMLAEAGHVGNWTLHFDWLTSPGIACQADSPGGTVRSSIGATGTQIITVFGDMDVGSITCTGSDGSRWYTTLPRDSRAALSVHVDALATWRPGARRIPLYITGENRFSMPQIHYFTRLE